MRTRVLRLLAIAAVLALVVLSACSYGGGGSSGGNQGGTSNDGAAGGGTGTEARTIVARDFAFSPSTLKISVGQTVTFVNEDSATHDVEIGTTNLGRMNKGDELTWTPDQPGTYDYRCTIHPSMKGTILVE